MSKIIKLRKGLDIKLQGEAELNITQLPRAEEYAVSPLDFQGITPKLLVKEGDEVKCGSALFFDKDRAEILFTSPISGVVKQIVRGEKRVITEIVITASPKQESEKIEIEQHLDKTSKEQIKQILLKSGLWTLITQRPYGIVANPNDTPKSIFISGFDSAPLAPDIDFMLSDQIENLRTGIDILKKLTSGAVHLSLREGKEGVVGMLTNAEQHRLRGPHPAGNVGIQIHHIEPINRGDLVWTVDIQSVAVIGRAINTKTLDMTRVVAVTGSEVEKPAYVRTIPGVKMSTLLNNSIKPQKQGDSVRVISGNVLTGRIASLEEGYLGYQTNQVTVIPEGDKYEILGWAMPRMGKFSVSKSYFSWLLPNRRYRLNTNMNGGLRPYIVTGLFEKYVPMDIYPLYLIKAILAEDIEKMENLGLYEVIEEDFALCEFVDPSKNDIQSKIREGINLMIKELS